MYISRRRLRRRLKKIILLAVLIAVFILAKIAIDNAKNVLEQMITISHNYAALLLTEKVKLSKVKQFLQDNGFSNSIVGTDGDSPKSTASDIALFFEKLYLGKLANQQNTQKMLDLLKKQTFNDKIPKNLPDEVEIAHKTGEINYLTHDAGIVFDKKGDYLIVILSESDYPPGSEERISLISKAVYDYFQNKL